MKNRLNPILTIMITSIVHLLSSCEGFLSEKPSRDLLVPETAEQLQALLDDENTMNSVPVVGLMAADNYFTTDQGWNAFGSTIAQGAYLWQPALFEGISNANDWTKPYEQVFYANVVLDLVSKKEGIATAGTAYGHLKGQAFFFRAHALLNLLELFSPLYMKGGLDAMAGIPMPVSPDVNRRWPRESVATVVAFVSRDLNQAVGLLPDRPDYRNRPSRPAALALLARLNLGLGNYREALDFAEGAIETSDSLIDFNGLDLSATYPISPDNPETIFYAETLRSVRFMISRLNFVDRELYASFGTDDLRRQVYFRNAGDEGDSLVNFTGNYTGSYGFFGGITVSELYLVAAECAVRTGNTEKGLEYLNTFLQSRYREGTFRPYSTTDQESALAIVLKERRKELPFRGHLRWTDLKRLNNDSRFAKTLRRSIGGKSHELAPQDSGYIFPFPENELDLNGEL